MEEAAERDLVVRCRQGSEAAFVELVDGFKGLVYGVIWRTTTDASRADDLAQEVFLKIHRGLPYFRGQARLSTWIYRIVLNVCSDARGPSGRERSLDDITPGTELAAGAASRDRAFGDVELRDRMEKALARLPPDVRFLVSAHYLGGRKYEELAAALDMPVGTVKSHLFRAKRRLRELLEKELA
jgi:RNA polymerase sigma-70 factor (ECF subfamily)